MYQKCISSKAVDTINCSKTSNHASKKARNSKRDPNQNNTHHKNLMIVDNVSLQSLTLPSQKQALDMNNNNNLSKSVVKERKNQRNSHSKSYNHNNLIHPNHSAHKQQQNSKNSASKIPSNAHSINMSLNSSNILPTHHQSVKNTASHTSNPSFILHQQNNSKKLNSNTQKAFQLAQKQNSNSHTQNKFPSPSAVNYSNINLNHKQNQKEGNLVNNSHPQHKILSSLTVGRHTGKTTRSSKKYKNSHSSLKNPSRSTNNVYLPPLKTTLHSNYSNPNITFTASHSNTQNHKHRSSLHQVKSAAPQVRENFEKPTPKIYRDFTNLSSLNTSFTSTQNTHLTRISTPSPERQEFDLKSYPLPDNLHSRHSSTNKKTKTQTQNTPQSQQNKHTSYTDINNINISNLSSENQPKVMPSTKKSPSNSTNHTSKTSKSVKNNFSNPYASIIANKENKRRASVEFLTTYPDYPSINSVNHTTYDPVKNWRTHEFATPQANSDLGFLRKTIEKVLEIHLEDLSETFHTFHN